MVRLIPRDNRFFEMFARMVENLAMGARLLEDILTNFNDVEVRVQQLQDIEHAGDAIAHSLFTTLNQTFITPFDREDVHRLASSLDDVLDFVHAAGERLVMYKVRFVPPAGAQLAHLVVLQAEQLAQAVQLIERGDKALTHCVEINRLENEADRVSREALSKLFEAEKDPINLIKLKEIYEVLETATDKAEDAANVIETVVLKAT